MKSVEYLKDAPQFDFALLDGSHISEDVQDEFEYLSMNKTPTYLLHDVNTQLLSESKNTPWYDGPMLLKTDCCRQIIGSVLKIPYFAIMKN